MWVRLLAGVLGAATLLGLVPPAAGADAQSVPPSELTDDAVDVEIWMSVDATNQDIAAVEQRIRTSTGVRRYAHLNKEDAYAEFRRIFAKNPDLIQSITANDLPESFRVDLRRTANPKKWERRFWLMSGVEDVGTNPTEPEMLQRIRQCRLLGDADLEVFMRLDATRAQFDAAMAAAGSEPGLTVIRVFEKKDAYKELKKIFKDNPDLVRSMKPADLPVSFRMQVLGSLTPEVLERLRALDGVDSVERFSNCKVIQAVLARGITLKELARLLVKQSR